MECLCRHQKTEDIPYFRSSRETKALRLLFSFILSLTIATQAGAERPLRTAVFDLTPNETSDGRPVGGIIPLINDALSTELGEPIESVTVSYNRMIRLLENGDVDFSIFFISPRSRQVADPVHVFYEIQTSMIARRSIQQSPADGSKLSLAYPRGIFFGTDLDTSTSIDKLFSNGHEHSVNLLVSGRVDAIAGPEATLFLLIEDKAPREDYFVLQKINLNRSALQFSKKSDQRHRLDDLRQAAQVMRDKGILSKLLADFPFKLAENGTPPTE